MVMDKCEMGSHVGYNTCVLECDICLLDMKFLVLGFVDVIYEDLGCNVIKNYVEILCGY